MGCSMKRAAAEVVVFTLLFLLAWEAEVVSGDPSASVVEVTHKTVHVRKLLNSTGDARGAAPVYAAERRMAPDDCSSEVVEVFQGKGVPLPDGIPSYRVTITNKCFGCTVRDVHVSCGEFASTELVNPSVFRRVADGDCLVRGGGPMGPGDTVEFKYSNSFMYPMKVASVSCRK